MAGEAVIFVEDTYGVQSLKIVVEKMKSECMIPKIWVKCRAVRNKMCSRRLGGIIEDACERYERVVMVFDGDGEPEKAREEQLKHIPKRLRRRIFMVVNEYELEDWVLHAYGITPSSKPTKSGEMDRLVQRLLGEPKYKKSMLPRLFKKAVGERWELLKGYERVAELAEALGGSCR